MTGIKNKEPTKRKMTDIKRGDLVELPSGERLYFVAIHDDKVWLDLSFDTDNSFATSFPLVFSVDKHWKDIFKELKVISKA